MPVRKFDEPSMVRYAIGACGVTGAVTMAALVKLDGTVTEEEVEIEEGVFENIKVARGLETGALITAVDAALGEAGKFYAFDFEPAEEANGNFTLYRNGRSNGPLTKPYGNIWALVVVQKVAGEAFPTFYVYRFDTASWVGPITGDTEIKDAPVNPGGFIQHGQWGGGEQLVGARYAAAAIWNRVLTEAEVKSLASVASLDKWLALAPVGQWMYFQANVAEAVADLTGNGANQVLRENTSVVAEEPPIPYFSSASSPGSQFPLSRCNPIRYY